MKKTLAILLALMLVLVNVAALATDVETDPTTEPAAGESSSITVTAKDPSVDTKYDKEKNEGGLDATAAQIVKVNKNFTVTGYNNTGKTPAHTLTFTVAKGTVTESTTITEAPDVTISDLALAEGATEGVVSINLPAYKGVGIYTYPVTETDTNVAGITYATNLELKVTVVQTEEGLVVAGIALRQDKVKTDTIENLYDSGALKVSKTVTGNMGDQAAVWEFTIVLTAPEGDTVKSTISIPTTSTGKVTAEKGEDKAAITSIAPDWKTKTVYAYMTHGQNIELDNLPAGVTYTVTETEDENYTKTETFSNTDKKITAGKLDTADFVNERGIDVDTGVTVETLPYVMILAIAMIGAVVMLRKREEY